MKRTDFKKHAAALMLGLVLLAACALPAFATSANIKLTDGHGNPNTGSIHVNLYDSTNNKALSGGEHVHTVFLSAQGAPFNQGKARELLAKEHFILVCGHYEGIDQRVIDEIVDMELSVGDFVMTGGEIPAMTVIDTVSRLVQGVLAAETSYENESHFNGLLEYPQYTRPAVWHDKPIPDVLISGHHAKIEQWKREQSLINTLKKRPDMLEKAELTKEDIKFLKKYK